MALEPCPTCGYAVSTVTYQCRHCSAAAKIKRVGMYWSIQNCGYLAGAVCLIYLIFFRR